MKFKEYLKNRDPEIYNEILGTLALGTAAAGLLAPRATGRAIKYIAKKGIDVGADVGSHVLKKGVDLGASALRAGASGAANLAGKGMVGAANLAGKGIVGAAGIAKKEIKRVFKKPEQNKEISNDQSNTPKDQTSGTWYA